jgi:hypothetical protein
MSFEVIVIAWCAASLLAGGGLVVWFVVELKIFTGWLSARRARRRKYLFPNVRVIRASKAKRSDA